MKTMFRKTKSLKELMVRVKHFTAIEQIPVVQEYDSTFRRQWAHLTYSTDLLLLGAEGIANLSKEKFWLHIENK